MVYKLGQRARFYRLRHARKQWLIGLGAVGLLAVGLLGVSIHPTASVLGLGIITQHYSSGASHSARSAKAGIRSGSSKRPPTQTVAAPIGQQPRTLAALRQEGCGGTSKNPGLASASNTELRKLADYQQVCTGQPVQRSSFFVPTPSTQAQAQDYANDVAATLKQYAQYGIAPLVFMEPDSATGGLLDLVQYKEGAYDAALDAYFAALKANGITDSTMGTWVMLPEGNIPVWTSVDPTVFSADVTKVAQFQKKYFPASKTSILLDSQTYPSANSWEGGSYASLVLYVQSIPKGLLDSFGLQGFPWAPPANQAGTAMYDPKGYLRIDLAAAAARSLGVSNIWLNTGTFSRAHTQSAVQTVSVAAVDRQAMLNGVLSEVKTLQGQGFAVSIHLFAQDKSATDEAINWSYWQKPGDGDTTVFTTFAHDLAIIGAPLWVFDTY